MQLLPHALFAAFPFAAAVDKGNTCGKVIQISLQVQRGGQTRLPADLFLHLGQLLFHAFSPHKGVSSRAAFQLRSVNKHRRVVCFTDVFQPLHQLIKQILQRVSAPSRAEPGEGAVIRRFSILQQPSEVNSVLTGFLQFSAGINPAQIPVHQYLEQHPGIRRRFSPFGRIRFVQFPVLQFLKLGV